MVCASFVVQSSTGKCFVLQSLHKPLPSTTLYYKTCTKHVPVLLCTTKLAQSTSQYYFVLQSLHKSLPSTTLYYKTCKKYFPVLLCTTKLAQRTSQYYFVLQSLHKPLPSTTLYYNACTEHSPLYYKACTKHFPILLCTIRLAQNRSEYYYALQSFAQTMSQHYFLLHSLHKARSTTTLYYKACTKHFPVLLSTKAKLDNGWPESVEEQSLLLFVWRHYITRQYIKDVL